MESIFVIENFITSYLSFFEVQLEAQMREIELLD